MPKLKTHSGAAKRFKKTGTGKFKRGQSKMRHILTSKATKTKRKLGRYRSGLRGGYARRSPACSPTPEKLGREVMSFSSQAARESNGPIKA